MEMMSWGMEMEFPSPASHLPNSNWFMEPKKMGRWTLEENKIFEKALAVYDMETPDRWQKVAEMIPGKSVDEVKKHYQDLEDDVSHIEAGLIPIPGYSSSSFTLEWVDSRGGFDGLKQSYGGKRPGCRSSDQERKKGVPWTEEEHRLFLMGLKKYGKGDWRNISRYFVISRTPTQVASHAQKYFLRLSSGGKDKRRSSIHDITTANLPDNNRPPSPSQLSSLSMNPNSVVSDETTDQFSVTTDSSHYKESNGNLFSQPSHGVGSYGLDFKAHETIVGQQSMLYQLQSANRHPHV